MKTRILSLVAVALIATLSPAQVFRYGNGCQHSVVLHQSKNDSGTTTLFRPAAGNRVYIRLDVARTVEASGFALPLASLTGPQYVNGALYGGSSSGPSRDPLRNGQLIYVNSERWARCYFAPIVLQAGSTVFLSVDQPTDRSLQIGTFRGGTPAQWHLQPLPSGRVGPSMTRAFQMRLLGDGRTPNIRVAQLPPASNVLEIFCDNNPPGSLAVLYYGFSPFPAPRPGAPGGTVNLGFIGLPQCELLVDVAGSLLPTGGIGNLRQFLTAASPNTPPLDLYFQWAVGVPRGSTLDVAFSDAAQVTF